MRPGAGRRSHWSQSGEVSAAPTSEAWGSPLETPICGCAGPRWGTYCREWPCGSPGQGLWCPRCREVHTPHSRSPLPTRRGCCPSLGIQERIPFGDPVPQPLACLCVGLAVGGSGDDPFPHWDGQPAPSLLPTRPLNPAGSSAFKPEVPGAQYTQDQKIRGLWCSHKPLGPERVRTGERLSSRKASPRNGVDGGGWGNEEAPGPGSGVQKLWRVGGLGAAPLCSTWPAEQRPQQRSGGSPSCRRAGRGLAVSIKEDPVPWRGRSWSPTPGPEADPGQTLD